MSGSRFLQPKLSRLFNQVAKVVRQPISRFISGAARSPPLPGIAASRFLAKPQTAPSQPAINAGAPSGSRFLRPELTRLAKPLAKARSPVSRFLAGAAALLPPLPKLFSSRFFTKPPTPLRHLRRDWPRKPDGPKR